jgi:hypothetical protein
MKTSSAFKSLRRDPDYSGVESELKDSPKKSFRIFNVHPVTRARDGLELGVGEPKVDQSHVLLHEEIRQLTAKEQGRAAKRVACSQGFAQARGILMDLAQADLPAVTANRITGDVVQEEPPRWEVGDRTCQGLLELSPRFKGAGVEREQRGKHPVEAPRIGPRRDIDDDEPRDLLRVEQGELHRDLAAHRVAQDMGAGQVMVLHELADVRRHAGVIHVGGVGRAAMIAQVHREDLEMLGQFLADQVPVAQRAEQAVQNDQRLALTIDLGMQLHAKTNSRLRISYRRAR